MVFNVSQNVLRTREAAAHVGLSASTLNKMRVRGDGPTYVKSGPRIVVYRLEDLDRWLVERRRKSTSELSYSVKLTPQEETPARG